MQLQRHLEEFERAGIAVFAVSYDPVEALRAFATEQGITYPLLSDAGSKVIEQFGILNTLVRPDEAVYGIPYPGSYVIDAAGPVVEKLFFQRYQVRPTAQSILKGAFGVEFDVGSNPSAEAQGGGVRIRAVLGNDALVVMQRTPLYVRLDLDEGLHLYGRPVPEGFIATEVTVTGPEGVRAEPARYPSTRPFHVDGIDDEFHVFEGDVEIEVPLTSSLRDVESARLEVTVSYQACDERQCFLPQQQVLHLDVPVGALNRPPPRE